MDKTLTIQISQEHEQTKLHLAGRLDTLSSRELDETIQNLPGEPVKQLELDMQQVTYLSSAGIRILIKYYKQCHESGGKCLLTHIPRQAADVLKMVGLEQLIPEQEKSAHHSLPVESEKDHIRFLVYPLHQEPANLICHDEKERFTAFHTYDLAVGKDQAGTEFIAWDKQIISKSEEQLIHPACYIGTHGSPSHFVTFHPVADKTIPLSVLLSNLLQLCEIQCAGVIIHAHSAGLIGLRHVSGQSMLTAMPLYTRHTTGIAGIIHTARYPGTGLSTRLLSPDSTLQGHLHAAIYPLETWPVMPISPSGQVNKFPTPGSLKTLLHLLYDNRPGEGSGESHLRQGYAWIIKIK